MADRIMITNMLEKLQIVDDSRVSHYRNQDGHNYNNDHSPMNLDQAIKKVELFIDFGGKITKYPDYIQVKWQAHSEGELVVYRNGETTSLTHGRIEVGRSKILMEISTPLFISRC